MQVWISALIPAKGADLYGGVRLQTSGSEQACYQDLALWLGGDDVFPDKTPTKAEVTDRLNEEVENSVLLLWKVEDQRV